MKNQKGMTLIEVLATLAIVSFVMAMGVGTYRSLENTWQERRKVKTIQVVTDAVGTYWEIKHAIPDIPTLKNARLIAPGLDTTGVNINIPGAAPGACMWNFSMVTVSVSDPSFKGVATGAGVRYNTATHTYSRTRLLNRTPGNHYRIKSIVDGCPVYW